MPKKMSSGQKSEEGCPGLGEEEKKKPAQPFRRSLCVRRTSTRQCYVPCPVKGRRSKKSQSRARAGHHPSMVDGPISPHALSRAKVRCRVVDGGSRGKRNEIVVAVQACPREKARRRRRRLAKVFGKRPHRRDRRWPLGLEACVTLLRLRGQRN